MRPWPRALPIAMRGEALRLTEEQHDAGSGKLATGKETRMPVEPDTNARMPYQLPMPADALADIVIPDAVPEDERLWVPQAANVWFRPLCLNRSQGYWMNLLKVRKAGVL